MRAALGAAAIAALGCGVKGPPKPPSGASTPPAAVSPKPEPGAPVQPTLVEPAPDGGAR